MNYREQKEHALCVFAFMIEAYGIMEDLVQPSFQSKLSSLLIQIINEVARPSFFIEEVGREYFNLISNLIQQSPKIFVSDIGTEYLAVFACSNANIFGSS